MKLPQNPWIFYCDFRRALGAVWTYPRLSLDQIPAVPM